MSPPLEQELALICTSSMKTCVISLHWVVLLLYAPTLSVWTPAARGNVNVCVKKPVSPPPASWTR